MAASPRPLVHDPKVIAHAVNEVLEARRFSISEWAKRSGVKEGTIRAIISGRTKSATIETLYRLAHGADVPIWRVLGETPPWAGDLEKIREELLAVRREEQSQGHLLDRVLARLEGSAHSAA